MSKENQKEREWRRKDKRATFFYDLSKMSLTASVVSLLPIIISEGHELRWIEITTVLAGLILCVILSSIANKIMK